MFRFIVLCTCVVLCLGYKEACGPNEEARCVQPCPPERTCLNRGIQFYCLLSAEPCEWKCVCKNGLIRNSTGQCIREDQCDPQCAHKNEIYTYCKKSCPPETCVSLVAEFSCDANEPCQRGCICKPGFLRKDLNSPCMPKCQCREIKYSPECKA